MKIVALKNGEYNLFSHYLTLSNIIFVCVLIFLSEFFVFDRKKLVLLNLVSRYVTFISEYFLKSEGTVDFCKLDF